MRSRFVSFGKVGLHPRRAETRQFDGYLTWHRIGAATIAVAQALDTMFSSDVAQVQALHKIIEQLMMRKQKAEEVVW